MISRIYICVYTVQSFVNAFNREKKQKQKNKVVSCLDKVSPEVEDFFVGTLLITDTGTCTEHSGMIRRGIYRSNTPLCWVRTLFWAGVPRRTHPCFEKTKSRKYWCPRPRRFFTHVCSRCVFVIDNFISSLVFSFLCCLIGDLFIYRMVSSKLPPDARIITDQRTGWCGINHLESIN